MTERYNSKTVNTSCVRFNSPEHIHDLHYYDFDTHTWRYVEIIKNLPYGLACYRFLDEDNEDGENDCVVTCNDSYRLCDCCDYDYTHENDREVMEAERVWRDEIVRAGSEFEYGHKKDGQIYYAKTCWIKSDIIPGVLLAGHRAMPNINPFGYIYKEYKYMWPIGTYLPIISQEQLDKEAKEKEEAEIRRTSKELIEKEWMSKLDYCSCKKWPNTKFRNTLPLYESLSKYRQEITLKDVNDYCIKQDTENKYNGAPQAKGEGFTLCILGLVSVAKDYDVCYVSIQRDIQYGYVYLGGYDIYFDIEIHNATHATLWCGDGSPTNKDCQEYGREFKLLKIDKNNGTSIYTFPDITFDNPLFAAIAGSSLCINTDGDLIKYNAGCMKPDIRNMLASPIIGNNWAISKIQGRYLLNGHLWSLSMSFPEEELVILESGHSSL